jgi:addiction module HigA family antidote
MSDDVSLSSLATATRPFHPPCPRGPARKCSAGHGDRVVGEYWRLLAILGGLGLMADTQCVPQSAFAVRLGVSFPCLNEVINAKRSVTPDTALRLARVTGMSADFWLGFQQDWDLWHALRSKKAEEIARLEPLEEAI